MTFRASICGLSIAGLILASNGVTQAQAKKQLDIRKLSQHFIDEKDSGPWQFSPSNNIKETSLTEHRGLVTIREAGQGQDIKGLCDHWQV